MKRCSGIVAASLLLAASAGLASAAEPKYGTGRYFQQYCRSVLQDSDSRELFHQGECVGMLQALSFFSEELPKQYKFCSPGTSTGAQLAKVAVDYMDKNVGELEGSFLVIAVKAFRAEWPCR